MTTYFFRGGWVEGVAILVAVLLVSSVTALNDYNKEKQFRALSEVDADKKIKVFLYARLGYVQLIVQVIRRGDVQVISTYDLLVGDVVCLESGDMIPADCVYIVGDGVKVDGTHFSSFPTAS